jgi:branched-chain amino acid transport system substrate-binding protein
VGSAASSSASAGSSSAASGAASGTPFRVLFIGDLTGATKSFGEQDLLGLETAADYDNAHGGIDGHPVAITKVSDNGDPSTAVSVLLSYLGSHPKPNWTYAGTESDEAAALVPVIKRVGILAGGLGANACFMTASSQCPTAFFAGPTLPIITGSVADYIEAHHYKKAGFLLDSLDACTGVDTLTAQSLKAHGIPYTISTFPISAVSLLPELDKLKTAGDDVVVFCTLGPSAGYAAKARAELNWNVPVVDDIVAASTDITKLVPASDLNNTVEELFRPVDGCLHLPGVTELLAEAKKYGGYPVGGALDDAAFAWDEMILLRDVANQAGSIDQSALVNGLNNLGSAASNDPLLLLDPTLRYSSANHADAAATPADMLMVPAGPIVNGQVVCGSSSSASSS